MDKRKSPRYKRRLHLRFWSRDDRDVRKGFTHNVSIGGMFIVTSTPFPPGTRLFIEIPSGRETLLLQGEVRYAARVDRMLQKVKPSGMGVRLLQVEEVMAELLRLKRPILEPTAAPAPEPATVEEATPEIETSTEPAGPVFPVVFETPHEFAKTYERDIKYGGLFVATAEPAEKDEQVSLEFRFQWNPELRVRVKAHVVKKFAAAEGSAAGEAVSGMGVAMSDTADVMAQFSNVFSTLDQSGEAEG